MRCAPSGLQAGVTSLFGGRFHDLDGERFGEGQVDRVTHAHAFEFFGMQHLDRARVARRPLERHRGHRPIDRRDRDRRSGLARQRTGRSLTQFGCTAGNRRRRRGGRATLPDFAVTSTVATTVSPLGAAAGAGAGAGAAAGAAASGVLQPEAHARQRAAIESLTSFIVELLQEVKIVDNARRNLSGVRAASGFQPVILTSPARRGFSLSDTGHGDCPQCCATGT